MQTPALRLSALPLLFPLLAAALIVSWSSGFVGIRYATEQAPVFMVLFWRSLVSGLLLLPFALLIGPRIPLRAVGEQALFGFLGMFLYLGGCAITIRFRVPTGLVALMAGWWRWRLPPRRCRCRASGCRGPRASATIACATIPPSGSAA